MAVMKLMIAIFLCASLAGAIPALAADPTQAREVARLNNCSPKKISVYQQSAGAEGKTVYQVDCVPAKSTNTAAPFSANALLVGCDASLCTLLRPMTDAVAK